jgi:membrane protease YdiL (CAAX protease family)
MIEKIEADGFTRRRRIALLAPVVLILTMCAAFLGFGAWLGFPLGYLVAFVPYWVGWCILFPWMIVDGLPGLLDLFRAGKRRFAQLGWKVQLALWWPIAFPLFFVFISRIGEANIPIILGSVVLGLVIGITEEILWRGVYVRLFPDNVGLNTIYPSVMFGLWHIAPQWVRTSTMPGGMASFVLYALVLGLSYAYYARKTGSIRWCAVSHCIHDALGLGAFVYSAWLM